MAILMCRPDFFGVEYEINPWMHVQVEVDHDLATRQWEALHDTYQRLGVDLDVAEPVQGLPDMVFSANAAVVWNRRAVLSSFHHAQRQGEEPHWRALLEARGFEVRELPRALSFEGAGDALFVGDRLFCGHGFRTDLATHKMVGDALEVETVSLELVDPRFYHLDTCFCPLNDRTVLFAPDALSPDSAALVRRLVPHVIQVPAEVAAGFACNAMPLGDRVVSSLAACKLQEPLAAAGFETIGLPMSEFMKSGGGVRCLSLPLDTGRS
ncbi:MAG: amidinotransferase [Candidatus Dormibacteraeota bacterium]|nr:amidinotransferase [Candidatus Dormibacteraeota bacterium]MBV9526191.1 amidinotransferase [Candidatus Dormibacteraeota bacterium]